MANITAAMVKELREKDRRGHDGLQGRAQRDAGRHRGGHRLAAQEGLAKAAKKAGRVAAEGLVAVESAGHHAAIVEVNSETDFVARNDAFQAFAREAAKIALNTDGTLEGLQAAKFPGATETVSEKLQSLIATIGENMNLRRVAKLEVKKGVIASYVHSQVSDGLGKIGVLVALESEGDVDALSNLGRQIAMHVAATNPVALDASGVDAATLERESNILREKNAGKPDHVLAKIVESGLKSYYKEVTLLEQPFVHDGSKTVSQVLKEAAGKVGGPVTLTAFVRYALGEGIEKEEGPDFATEVAQQAGRA